MFEDPSERPAGLTALAERHGVSLEAVRHLLRALEAGQGQMAQFDHPDLGGFGQWSAGGMIMVGRMNDHALKARVAALCADLAASLPALAWDRGAKPSGGSTHWWPEELGLPASAGAQNTTRYAYFPGRRRLAVERDGQVSLYDTGPYVITGASQAQSGSASFQFSGPDGPVRLEDLTPVDLTPAPPRPETAPGPKAALAGPAAPSATTPVPSTAPAAAPASATEILAILEKLADLHGRGVLTEAEFAAKKAELLARL